MPENRDNPVPSIRVHTNDLDENGFAKLWNIASASSEGNLDATRRLAASLLCFLCHKKAVTSWLLARQMPNTWTLGSNAIQN
ncbi:MAG: hypothetical protein VX694_10425 [Planctomycetota bacterium]|nr:hypothetical protein [Planctomycetota bacterium]MEC7679675.1 hypothetical protein [Planctomycetota bacterium]